MNRQAVSDRCSGSLRYFQGFLKLCNLFFCKTFFATAEQYYLMLFDTAERNIEDATLVEIGVAACVKQPTAD